MLFQRRLALIAIVLSFPCAAAPVARAAITNLTVSRPGGTLPSLDLVRFTGREELSRPFHFDLELLSPDPVIDPLTLLGTALTVRTDEGPGTTPRFFNGLVESVSNEGPESEAGLTAYTIALVPRLSFLSLTSDSRIFQEQSARQVVSQVLAENGITDVEMLLPGNEPTSECTVQYRETDFNFVSRLMEEEGIFYYFRHEETKHVMVLANSNAAFPPLPGGPLVSYVGEEPGASPGITEMTLTAKVTPGRAALKDYNFEMPSADMNASAANPNGHELDDFEIYDYPGKYATQAQGAEKAQVLLKSLQSEFIVGSGTATLPTFAPGGTFTLASHPSFSGAYYVRSTEHAVAGDGYATQFKCARSTVDYRPSRATPKPVIAGPQTAVVVGDSGEGSHADEYGRVKVQFHWDRYGTNDENSSCWIRVSQTWARSRFGKLEIPRIGQEVIVDFLEGDPDRPIINGRVYNAEDLPPALPGPR